VQKVMGIDQVIDGVVQRLGKLERAYLIDDYAEGKDSGIIDVVLVGDIDPYHLNDLTRKTEKYIKRRIRTLVLNRSKFKSLPDSISRRPSILIWQRPVDSKDGAE
jgi:hypothetical protein